MYYRVYVSYVAESLVPLLQYFHEARLGCVFPTAPRKAYVVTSRRRQLEYDDGRLLFGKISSTRAVEHTHHYKLILGLAGQ